MRQLFLSAVVGLSALLGLPNISSAQHHGGHAGGHAAAAHGGGFHGSAVHGGAWHGGVAHGGAWHGGSYGHGGYYGHGGNYWRGGRSYYPGLYGLGYWWGTRPYGGWDYYYGPSTYVYDTPTYWYSPTVTVPAVTVTQPTTVIEEQEPRVVTAAAPAYLEVKVPADAKIWVDGVLTTQTGSVRHFTSPALDAGQTFTYDMRARWFDVSGQPIEQARQVKVRANDRIGIDFTTNR